MAKKLVGGRTQTAPRSRDLCACSLRANTGAVPLGHLAVLAGSVRRVQLHEVVAHLECNRDVTGENILRQSFESRLTLHEEPTVWGTCAG